jgi:hypothetical protein
MFNLFKKKKKENTYIPNQKYKLLIINDDSTNLADALGITDDILYEIIEIGLNALKSESDFALALEKAIEQINHMNEATYLILVMGRAHHRSEIVNTLKDAL